MNCFDLKKEDIEEKYLPGGLCRGQMYCRFFNPDSIICTWCGNGYNHPCCPAVLAAEQKTQEEKK